MMIKRDVVTAVCDTCCYSRGMVENVLDAVLNTVSEALERGEKVQFADFGTFEPKRRAARIGRNPHTKEAVPIPARVIPSFRAGEKLKKAVMKSESEF